MAKEFELKVALTAQTQQYMKQLQQAQGSTKKFSSSMKGAGNQMKGAFGGVGSIFGALNNKFTGLISMAGSAGQAFGSLVPILRGVTAAVAATGIGMVLLAVVGALSAMKSYLTGTQSGALKLKKVLGGLGGVLAGLAKRIQLVGKGLFEIFAGHFKQGWKDLKESVKGVGEEMKNNWQTGKNLGEREFKLEQRKIKFITRRKQLEVDLAEYRRKANDKEHYSARQRYEFNKKAEETAMKIANESMAIKQEELDILKKKNALGNNTLDDDRKEAELAASILDERKAQETVMRTLVTRESTLTKEMEKEQEIIRSMREDAAKGMSKAKLKVGLDVDTSGITSRLARMDPPKVSIEPSAKEDKWEELDNRVKNFVEKAKGPLETYGNMALDMSDALSMAFQAAANRQIKLAAGNEEMIAKIRKKAARREKAIRMGQAAMAGAQAIISAMAPLEFPFSLIAAAIVGAQVAAQMAVIASQKFATGGVVRGISGTDRIPIMATAGEMVLNKGQQENLFKMIQKGKVANPVNIPPEIRLVADGDQLIGVIQTTEKQANTY